MNVSRSFAVGEVLRAVAPTSEPSAESAPVVDDVRAENVVAGMLLADGTLVVDAWWRDGMRVLDVGRDRRWVLAPEHVLRVVRS